MVRKVLEKIGIFTLLCWYLVQCYSNGTLRKNPTHTDEGF